MPSNEELAAWKAADEAKQGKTSARRGEGMEWSEVQKIIAANLPETAPPLPYELTDEGKRLANFRKICPPEFMAKIDRTKVPNPAAFDTVAGWNGRTPGILAWGDTDTAKSRAAWSALGRLYVKEGRTFAWFSAKRLVDELERYESKHAGDEFWRFYSGYDMLFVDDADKINWQFESQGILLFQFYDWVYRAQRPCITTTNRSREWWTKGLGGAFTRRLFDDCHSAVKF